MGHRFAAGLIHILISCPQVLVRHNAGERLCTSIQSELGTLAIALVAEPPTQYIDEYAPDRELRLALARSMLRAPSLREQLAKASVAEDVVVLGALPHARPLSLTVTRVPASFVPFNGSMLLRVEGQLPRPRPLHRRTFFGVCCRARFLSPLAHSPFLFSSLISWAGLEMLGSLLRAKDDQLTLSLLAALRRHDVITSEVLFSFFSYYSPHTPFYRARAPQRSYVLLLIRSRDCVPTPRPSQHPRSHS